MCKSSAGVPWEGCSDTLFPHGSPAELLCPCTIYAVAKGIFFAHKPSLIV